MFYDCALSMADTSVDQVGFRCPGTSAVILRGSLSPPRSFFCFVVCPYLMSLASVTTRKKCTDWRPHGEVRRPYGEVPRPHGEVRMATPGPHPANRKHLYNIYTLLAQRRRRWVELYKCYTMFCVYWKRC